MVSELSSSSVIWPSVHRPEEVELDGLHVDRVEALDALVKRLEDGGELGGGLDAGGQPGPSGEDLRRLRRERGGRRWGHEGNLRAAASRAAVGGGRGWREPVAPRATPAAL